MLGLNSLMTAGVGALGVRLDPFTPFNFIVELDGLIVGGFSQVLGVEGTIEVGGDGASGQRRTLQVGVAQRFGQDREMVCLLYTSPSPRD